MAKATLAWTAVTVGALSVYLSSPARGGERYYSMIFGSQSSPKLLQFTHTWATFIRVVGEGDDPNGYISPKGVVTMTFGPPGTTSGPGPRAPLFGPK